MKKEQNWKTVFLFAILLVILANLLSLGFDLEDKPDKYQSNRRNDTYQQVEKKSSHTNNKKITKETIYEQLKNPVYSKKQEGLKEQYSQQIAQVFQEKLGVKPAEITVLFENLADDYPRDAVVKFTFKQCNDYDFLRSDIFRITKLETRKKPATFFINLDKKYVGDASLKKIVGAQLESIPTQLLGDFIGSMYFDGHKDLLKRELGPDYSTVANAKARFYQTLDAEQNKIMLANYGKLKEISFFSAGEKAESRLLSNLIKLKLVNKNFGMPYTKKMSPTPEALQEILQQKSIYIRTMSYPENEVRNWHELGKYKLYDPKIFVKAYQVDPNKIYQFDEHTYRALVSFDASDDQSKHFEVEIKTQL